MLQKVALVYGLALVWRLVREPRWSVTWPDSYGLTPLHIIAQEGHNDLLDNGILIKYLMCKDALGRTPLHVAAKNGHVLIVRALLKAGASADEEDDVGYTALHLAVEQDEWQVIQELRKNFSCISQDVLGNAVDSD